MTTLSVLGAFAELLKATMSFVLSDCPPQGTTRLKLDRFSYLSIFRKYVEKIHVSLKYDNNNGTLHEDRYTVLIVSLSVLLRMRNVSDKSCRENQNTRAFCVQKFF